MAATKIQVLKINETRKQYLWHNPHSLAFAASHPYFKRSTFRNHNDTAVIYLLYQNNLDYKGFIIVSLHIQNF